MKTALTNLGRIEGKVRETMDFKQNIITRQLKTSAYTCGRKVKNRKLSMRKETTVL